MTTTKATKLEDFVYMNCQLILANEIPRLWLVGFFYEEVNYNKCQVACGPYIQKRDHCRADDVLEKKKSETIVCSLKIWIVHDHEFYLTL